MRHYNFHGDSLSVLNIWRCVTNSITDVFHNNWHSTIEHNIKYIIGSVPEGEGKDLSDGSCLLEANPPHVLQEGIKSISSVYQLI